MDGETGLCSWQSCGREKDCVHYGQLLQFLSISPTSKTNFQILFASFFIAILVGVAHKFKFKFFYFAAYKFDFRFVCRQHQMNEKKKQKQMKQST